MYTKIFQNKFISTKSISASVFLMSFSSAPFAAVYLAQNAQGTGDGSSCANARAASWFNTSGNWGTGSTQINPSNIVNLCGSISTSLMFQGSGTAGNYITVNGTGATYSGTFTVSDRSWWKIQNVSWASGKTSQLVIIKGGSNGIFTGNTADNVSGDPAVWIAQGAALPNNITISNNFIRTTTSDLGNVQLDIIKTEGSNNVIVEGNYLEMRAGGAGSNAHDDVIQTYESGSSSSKGGPSNWTVRYNKIVMNSSASADRSWTMFEHMSGTNNIYGNVFLGLNGAGGANGLNAHNDGSSAVFNIVNNTFVSKGTASNNVLNLSGPGQANIRGNIIHTVNQTALTGDMNKTRDHNLWYGNNIPSCSGYTGELCKQDPLFTDYTNNNFSLKSSSPAINAASNLGSPYNWNIAAGSTWPNPTLAQRPASGNWAMSAYEYNSNSSNSIVLMPPTNLKIQL
jgi:hypothetical protein